MTIDLSKLSLSELLALQKDLVLELPRRAATERQKAIEEMKQLAAERGFDLKELLGADKTAGKTGKETRAPVAVKYRSKDGQDWSGRGRKPGWVVDHLNAGGKLEDLSV